MADDRPDTTTRRRYLGATTTALGGAVAGCAGVTSVDSGGGSDHTVEMAPMGKVTFDGVPETWIPWSGDYADMGVALGQGDGLVGIGGADRYYSYVYEELPGVEFDRDRIAANPEVRTKEQFYAIGADAHLYDTEMLKHWFDWDQSDVEEIAGNVAPFLGNLVFRREDEWHEHRYYTLYEAFEIVAELFDERERYEAFAELHESVLADVQSRLPPASERPSVLLTFEGQNDPESFSPYRLNDQGTSKKQWRDLGIADALAGTGVDGISTTDRGELDYEGLLEVDPDVLLIRGHERKSASEFRDTVLSNMRDHPAGREITAVQEGRVYRGGFLYQGPIQNLFLTERAAKQCYPDEFGQVGEGEQLFDRDRVAEIVRGEV